MLSIEPIARETIDWFISKALKTFLAPLYVKEFEDTSK
jgi:hypothetical protein